MDVYPFNKEPEVAVPSCMYTEITFPLRKKVTRFLPLN